MREGQNNVEKIKLNTAAVLRLLTPLDAPDIFNAIDTQRRYLAQWLPFVSGTRTIEDTLRYVRTSMLDFERGDYVFVIACEEQFAGLIGFKDTDRENRRTELGYWLREEYQGRGLMTESVKALCRWAFRKQRMFRVQIKCATENIRSRAIPERLGFVHEGTERGGARLANGRHTNLEVYSRLRTDKAK